MYTIQTFLGFFLWLFFRLKMREVVRKLYYILLNLCGFSLEKAKEKKLPGLTGKEETGKKNCGSYNMGATLLMRT